MIKGEPEVLPSVREARKDKVKEFGKERDFESGGSGAMAELVI